MFFIIIDINIILHNVAKDFNVLNFNLNWHTHTYTHMDTYKLNQSSSSAFKRLFRHRPNMFTNDEIKLVKLSVQPQSQLLSAALCQSH